MTTWRKGTELDPVTQAAALSRFVYRCTVENFHARPEVERYMREAGYTLRALTDKEWLACTEFETRKDGRLSERNRFCRTFHPDHSATETRET